MSLQEKLDVPSILIRDVDDALHKRLKASAASHRRSLEEEARALLRAAVAQREGRSRENLADIAQRLFGVEHGGDLDLPRRGRPPRSTPPDLVE